MHTGFHKGQSVIGALQETFIITDELKLHYYRGLSNWGQINGYLTDTCLTAQDHYKALLDYFKIRY